MTNVAAPGVAVLATAVAFASLAILHVVSPEFQPSWRMVSDYANGRHRWLLSVMFAAWAFGSFALAVALGPITHGWLGRIGLLFLVLAGIGELMAAFFDINHRLHGPGDDWHSLLAHRGGAAHDCASAFGRTGRPAGVEHARHVDQLRTDGGNDDALHALVVAGRRRPLRSSQS